MHGDAARADFTGLAGPDDPTQLALFAADEDGRLLAVMRHNRSHPTTFYGAGCYSPDLTGAARAYLRQAVGPIPVLFLNGAFGDIGMEAVSVSRPRAEAREQKLARAAHLLAGETLRLLHEVECQTQPCERYGQFGLDIRRRSPAPLTATVGAPTGTTATVRLWAG